MRKLESVKKADASDMNSLVSWWKIRHPLRVYFNFWILKLGAYSPSLRLKNALYRLTGMKIGRGARIAPAVTIDFFWPERVEIGDGAIIGYGCTILAHEFLAGECRIGSVKIGRRALIGANSTVLAGVSVGEEAQVSAMSLVNASLPARCLAGGIPARVIKAARMDGKTRK